MKDIRKKRLSALLAGSPYHGDRGAFLRDSGLSKGRLSQLLDPNEPFGDVAARNLVESLGLKDGYFESDDSEPVQIDPPAKSTGEASATAMEIAMLYDLIPVSDRVRRVKAYNAATAAILAVLEAK